MTIKRVSLGYSKRKGSADIVKIETPGGCITVQIGLREASQGRRRIRIDVEANCDRFAGESPWWFVPGDSNCCGTVGWFEQVNKKGE